MELFDAVTLSFGTAGTGGFGIYSDSAAPLTSYQTWVVTVFMLLFGVNFNLYYLILIRRFRSALRSTELWVYVGIVALSTALICINVSSMFPGFWDSLEHSAFQVSSIITTTGFSTVDFNLWPSFSKTILVVLMFVGASAGSTGGGIKVSRIILFFKICHSEIRHMIHPRSVNVLRLDGKKVDPETRKGVSAYLVIYALCFFAIFLFLSLDGYDLETNFTATAACFNNIGPGLALVGPAANYGFFSAFSKILLSFAMLLGRLEIWPILLTLTPSLWKGSRHVKKENV